jgi:hypothetical protein
VSYRLGFKANHSQTFLGQALDEVCIPLDLKSLQALQQAGARAHVPPPFYDNEIYNRISFDVYHTLLDALSECGVVLEDAGTSKYLNLVGVFFQELLRILCAYAFKRYELDYLADKYGVSLDELKGGTPSSYPYVDYDFVANPACDIPPMPFESGKRLFDARQLARQLLDLRGKLNLSGKRRLQLAGTSNVQSDIREVAGCLNGQGNTVWDVRVMRPGQARIHIPHFDEQFRILEANLCKLFEKLGMTLPDSLISIIEQRIKPLVRWCDDKQGPPDVLLTGSLVHPEARVTAAHMKSLGVPVLSVFHGEACGAHDEPVFGYGENTYADAVVGYGDTGCALAANGEYSSSLFGDPVRYIPSTSGKVNDLHREEAVKRLADIESPRFMYVPTSFIESGRYGPYRDMHDVAYLDWQKELLDYAGEQWPDRVFWKPHIKERSEFAPPRIDGVQLILDTSFEEVIHDADVFIFDYVSTAFTLAAATNKPIIYLDIGLRNIAQPVMKDIIDRCIYVKADPQKSREALDSALKQADKQCVNRYSTNLSISSDKRPRNVIIAETLSGLVKQDSRA